MVDDNLVVQTLARDHLPIGCQSLDNKVVIYHVTLEHLLPHLLEPVPHLVDDNLVVQTLARDHLPIGGQSDSWHAVHTRVCNVLHVHGDVPLPHSEGLVIAGGDEPPVPVHEGDGVDRGQMPVVLLHNVS